MRHVTRQIAFEPGGWTPERAAKVTELFDGLAPGWNQREGIQRLEPLLDALDRGGPFRDTAVELGSGTGLMTATIASHFASVVAVDLSMEMLRLAPSVGAPRVQADGAHLPLPDGSAGAVVLVNAFLFPDEVHRVTQPGSALVWVNTVGDRTPIHLPAEEVDRALGGNWEGVAAEAGWGTWAVFRRPA
jgi:SAM-dependent methyltransferase